MTVIRFRRDTSANWTSVNPIPTQGEPCYETDTGKLKIGNGSDSYTALPYVSDDGGTADLPIASTTTLGGIKVGDNLTIASDGTLSASAGGTTDYTQLENKPQINSVELAGNKTLDDLGIQAKGDYLTALPDNAVTTDTEQTITGKKSLPLSTTLGRFSFGKEGFDDSIGKIKWTLDNGDTAGLDISRYHWYGFLRNGQKVWYIQEDDTNNIQTWNADKNNIVIKTARENGLKIVGKNDGVDLELTNATGAFSFLRSKDVDGSTITFSDGVLKANIPSVNVATTDAVGTVKPDNTTITVDSDGAISAVEKIATSSSTGSVKPDGSTISIAKDGTISMVGIIPTKTSQLTNDSGFLTEAPVPTNMVTTDTTQTISGSKTFTKSITTTSIYPSDEITFNSTSTSRYINNVDTISGGYQAENGYLTFKGTTTLAGDNKLVLDGRNGGITLQADSGKAITIGGGTNTIILSPSEFAYINGDLKIRRAFSLLLPNATDTKNTELSSNSDRLNIRTSNTRNLASGSAVSITDYSRNPILKINYDGSITNGDLATFINTANIDTTYMKWDTNTGKLTVDTAAVAHLAMPSSATVNLTLAASGAKYTAPADGYFAANTSSSYTGWFKFASICAQGSTPNGHQFACSCATHNGESPKVWYSFSSGDTSAIIFKFVYANGTVPST